MARKLAQILNGTALVLCITVVMAWIATPRALASGPDGCGCDLDTYHRELRQVRELLTSTWNGKTDEAVATGWAWGINPCRAGPLSTPARYAWFDSNPNKCHEHCMAEPWRYRTDSWDACLRGGRSFCAPKGEALSHGAVHLNCEAHGTHREQCLADPFCEIAELPENQSQCQAVPGHFYEGGHCYSDTCRRVPGCDPHWLIHCTVNCNDCQNLAQSSLDHLHLQCFSTAKLEGYYIHGNHGQPGDSAFSAGTHSMVKLVPKEGSVAELMAPLGFVADSLEGVKLRRITATRVVKGGTNEVDREAVTLTPKDKDDFSEPLEMLPHELGVSGAGQIELSSGCHATLPTDPANRAQLLRTLSPSVQSYYQLLQGECCGGASGAASERDEALRKIRATTDRYSAGMAGIE